MPTAQISEIRFFIGCEPAVFHYCIGTTMSQLVPFVAQITMTSREIAELTGKRHDNVLRDIDNLVENLPSELRYGFQSGTYVSGDPPREYQTGTMVKQFINPKRGEDDACFSWLRIFRCCKRSV